MCNEAHEEPQCYLDPTSYQIILSPFPDVYDNNNNNNNLICIAPACRMTSEALKLAVSFSVAKFLSYNISRYPTSYLKVFLPVGTQQERF